MSDDEFDNLPDDFANVQGVDWESILAPTITRSPGLAEPPPVPGPHSDSSLIQEPPRGDGGQGFQPLAVEVVTSTPPHALGLGVIESSTSFSSYFDDEDDEMDSSFLAELDRVEQQALGPPEPQFVVGSSSHPVGGSGKLAWSSIISTC